MGKFLFVLSLLLLSATMLCAQMCGQGIYTIKFTAAKGQTLKKIDYKVFSIKEAFADSIITSLYDSTYGDRLRQNIYDGVLIDAANPYIRRFIATDPAVTTWDIFGDTSLINRSPNIVLDSVTMKRIQAFYAGLARSLVEAAQYKGLGEIKFADVVKKGLLQFPTSETYSRTFLLQLTSGTNKSYLLGYLFGGCNRTVNIRQLKGGKLQMIKKATD